MQAEIALKSSDNRPIKHKKRGISGINHNKHNPPKC